MLAVPGTRNPRCLLMALLRHHLARFWARRHHQTYLSFAPALWRTYVKGPAFTPFEKAAAVWNFAQKPLPTLFNPSDSGRSRWCAG